jgi:hypothetical protein
VLPNNEMQQTRPGLARASLLISVFGRHGDQEKSEVMVLTLAFVATVLGPSRAADRRTPDLFVPREASEIAWRRERGMETVTFKLETPYPATSTLDQIRAQVESRGWKPLHDDFLNPGLPSAHVRGWGTIVDATEQPNVRAHVWHAQWSHVRGDVLLYHLEFRCSLDDREHSKVMRVSAALVPRAVYEDMKRDLKELEHPRGAAER